MPFPGTCIFLPEVSLTLRKKVSFLSNKMTSFIFVMSLSFIQTLKNHKFCKDSYEVDEASIRSL